MAGHDSERTMFSAVLILGIFLILILLYHILNSIVPPAPRFKYPLRYFKLLAKAIFSLVKAIICGRGLYRLKIGDIWKMYDD